MLAPLGVTEEMQRIGIKVPHWQIRDRKQGVIVEWDLGLIADQTAYPYRFHLEQHRLTPILFHKLHAYRHASVRFSTQVTTAAQDGDSVIVQTSAGTYRTPWLIGADDAAHLNNPLGAFGLNGGLHDAVMLADYLGKVVRGEADDSLLDRYVRQRRTANVEFVQTQSIANKRMLEEGDPAAREQNFADLRRVAADRTAARDFLLRSSMIWSVPRAAEIA